MTRKIFFFSLALLPLGLASHALAAEGFVALAPIPGLTTGEVANSYNLPLFFNNLYKYLIGIAAALAFIEITLGGLQISTQDSISKQGEGRERIQQAVFGLILVLSPALVFGIINPNILNLQLGLAPINLNFTPYTPTVSTPEGPSSAPKSGMWCFGVIDEENPFECAASQQACEEAYGRAQGTTRGCLYQN